MYCDTIYLTLFIFLHQGCTNTPYLSTKDWTAPPGFPERCFRPGSMQTASTSPQERRLAGSHTGSRCPSAGWRFCQYYTSISPWCHWCTWEMGYQTEIGSHAFLMGQNLVRKVGGVRVEVRGRSTCNHNGNITLSKNSIWIRFSWSVNNEISYDGVINNCFVKTHSM